MRVPAMIVGAILIVLGALVASGVFKYQKTETVLDIGSIEIEKTEDKSVPFNWGYALLAGGALVLVVGAVAGKNR